MSAAGPARDGDAGCVVTGASGFIGAHLVRHLAARGERVRALDVRPAPADAPADVEWRRVDVRDRNALAPLIEEGCTVYHLASAHLDPRLPAREFEEVNVRAVEGLVRACAERGARRLVHTSSVGIYGHVEHPPADEESPKHPGSPYEVTKLAGETAAVRAAAAAGVDVIVLRPTWVYGPGCPRTRKLLDAVRRRRFVYIGDGSNLRHPMWIGDLLEAYDSAAAAPAARAGEAYIVGGPEVLTLRTMVETCARVLGVPPPRLAVPRAMGPALGWSAERLFGLAGREPPISRRTLALFENDNAFDTGKARRELGFAARTRFEEGIRATLAGAGIAGAAPGAESAGRDGAPPGMAREGGRT